MAKMTKPHKDEICEELAVKGTHECIETVHKYIRGEMNVEDCSLKVATIMIMAMKYYAEEVQLN